MVIVYAKGNCAYECSIIGSVFSVRDGKGGEINVTLWKDGSSFVKEKELYVIIGCGEASTRHCTSMS